MPRRVTIVFVLAAAAIAVAVGCARRCVPNEISKERHLIDLSQAPGTHAPISPGLLKDVSAEFRRRGAVQYPPGTRPYAFLAMSGGGVYGAFGAGVLNGWTAAGTRPEFDVVTGISTGGLMATFAFLGPKYDSILQQAAVEDAEQRNIMRRLMLVTVPYYDAFFSAAPLSRQLQRLITSQVLAEVAQAHAAGRRLYIGTTNLDSRRLAIWDMGAIASRGTPEAFELYHQVVLASSAVPIVFPPVKIPVEVNGRCYEELHVDGGVSDEVIFRGFMVGDLNRANGLAGTFAPAGSTLYVINNGKLYADPTCVRRSLVSIVSATSGSVLYGKTRDELHRIYLNCMETGTDFRLTALPQELPIGSNFLRVSREDRERIFAAGYSAGQTAGHGPEWRDLPPGTDPTEQALPRAGTSFMTPKPVDEVHNDRWQHLHFQ